MAEELSHHEDEPVEKPDPKDELGNFMAELERLNVDSSMIKFMGGGFGLDDFEKDKMTSGASEEFADKYADFLGVSGLTISSKELMDHKTGEKCGKLTEEMIIDIENRKKFGDFLRSFKKEDLSEQRIEGLVSLGVRLGSQIAYNYEPYNPEEERFINLAASLGILSQEYKRLAEETGNVELNNCAWTFAEYEKATSGGYLKEVLKIESTIINFGLFLDENQDPNIRKIKKFNKDYPKPADHEKVWEQIVDVIQGCAKNPKARQFLREFIETISSDISIPQEEFEKAEWSKRHIDVLNQARSNLEKIKETLEDQK